MSTFKVLTAQEEAHKLQAARGISGTAIARDTVWQSGQKFSSGHSQSGTNHQRTELRPIAGPLRMKQRPSRVKGVTFVLPGDRGTRAPSPLSGRAGHGRRSAAAGAQRDRGNSKSSRKGTRNKTFSARAAALQRKTQVALDTQTQFLLASLGSHDEKRKAYMYRPERRHTSGRGQTFIAKRPGLLDVVRAYYMTPEQLKERDEADAKAKAKAKKKADKALAAQEKQRKRFAWERGPTSPTEETSSDSQSDVSDEDSKDKQDPSSEFKIANNAFYTDQALLKREALRFDPEVLGVLDELWRCVDLNHDERVDKQEYIEMSRKVYDVFVADGDAEASARIASDEWEADRFGHDHLDKHRFRQCWFQLSDLWTDTIEPEEYAAFLRDVLNCLAVRGADGELHFREKPVAIATLKKRSEPKPRPRSSEPKPKVYFDPDKHSKLRARTAEALQMDLERRRSQFVARQMHQIGQANPDARTRRVTLSFGGPNRPDEEENGSRSGGNRRGGGARGGMSWSGGLGLRHGRSGLDGFDLGDMGLIEEGEEEFEEDFQEPSTFYDATPSAFKASAGRNTDLSPLVHKAKDFTEIRAGEALHGAENRVRQGYRTKNKQRGGFRQQLEQGRLYVGSGGAELGVGDMDSRGASPSEFDETSRNEEIMRKRKAIYERAERARRAAAELTAEDLPDDADPRGLFEQASLLTSSLASVESTASSHLRDEAWRIRGLLPALLSRKPASDANSVPEEQEQELGCRHAAGKQGCNEELLRDRSFEQQPKAHLRGVNVGQDEDNIGAPPRPMATRRNAKGILEDLALPIEVQSAAPYCNGVVRFADGEQVEVCSCSEASSDNDADRIHDADAHDNEDHALWQITGDCDSAGLQSDNGEVQSGSGVNVDISEQIRSSDGDSFSQLMQMARQDSNKVGEWLLRRKHVIEHKGYRLRDTMPEGYGDANDGFQRCMLEQKRRFGEICLQNEGRTGKEVANGGCVVSADARPTTAPASITAASTMVATANTPTTATAMKSLDAARLTGVAPGLKKTMQWALGLDVVPLKRSIQAHPHKYRPSLTQNDVPQNLIGKSAVASACAPGVDDDALSESSSDAGSVASSVEQIAYSAYGSGTRAQEAFHESVQRHDRHVRQHNIVNKTVGDIGHARAKQRVARDRAIAANEKNAASHLRGRMFFNPSQRRCCTAQASRGANRHHQRRLQTHVPDHIRWGGRHLRGSAKHWSPVTEDWVVGKPSHLVLSQVAIND